METVFGLHAAGQKLEKLLLEQGFQDLRADASDLFFEAILQRELLGVQNRSYQYMLQLSQSDSLRYAAGEITENDARQSKLEAMTLLECRFYNSGGGLSISFG